MRILVIDDSPERQCRFARELLALSVSAALSHDDAIRLLGSSKYDLIFLDGDLSLAGGEGEAIAHHLAGTVNATTPVIIHSMNIALAKRIRKVISTSEILPFNLLQGKIRQHAFSKQKEKQR